MKLCSACRSWKETAEFHRSKSNRDGLQYQCKECQQARRVNSGEEGKRKRSAAFKRWYLKNTENRMDYRANYRAKNKETLIQKSKAYKAANRERVNLIRNASARKKRAENIQFRIQNNLRSRMWYALKRSSSVKHKSAVDLVGCDMDFLKSHIEKQFLSGMSWENHSITGWHIDHIIPCHTFDLSDPDQQKKCFHWSNLQPLWSKDNCSKNQYSATTNQTAAPANTQRHPVQYGCSGSAGTPPESSECQARRQSTTDSFGSP